MVDSLQSVLVWATIAMMKHYEQKQDVKERIYFSYISVFMFYCCEETSKPLQPL